MLQSTAGSATVNGYDVATQMDQIRASLGICPQFDILWPDLTVYEHLQLYGAIKGYLQDELREVRQLTGLEGSS
jgi:ATP-binding cassette subfamily A (ABC1) protein 3